MEVNFSIMIILTSSLQSIVASISAVTTNNLPALVCYRETTSTDFTPKRNAVNLSGSGSETLLQGVSGASIGIDYINVYNQDTVASQGSIVLSDDGTDYILWSGSLEPGERVEYCKAGFIVKDALGTEKTSYNINYEDKSTSSFSLSTLSSPVSTTSTSLGDVTGLSFPVVANKLYWFRFVIRYQSALASTGAGFAINGPALNYLYLNIEASNSSTTVTTTDNINAYDTGPLATSSSNNPNGRGILVGLIQTTANGDVIARFRSEISGSAITVNPGSFAEWEEIFTYP
jgi:hypothetical protein